MSPGAGHIVRPCGRGAANYIFYLGEKIMRILSSIVFASAVAAGASSAFADSILYVDDSNGGLAKVDADTGSTTFI